MMLIGGLATTRADCARLLAVDLDEAVEARKPLHNK